MSAHPLTSFTNEFLTHYKLKITDDNMTKLVTHMDALIFNITAIACVIGMLNDDKTINVKHLEQLEGYVKNKCGNMKQSGGTSMASDFFGYPHPQYSVGNENTNNTNIETIDFVNGVARAAMGPALESSYSSSGGSHKKYNKDLDNHIRRVLKHHNMKITKDAKQELIEIIHQHIRCFAKYLRGKTVITKIKEVSVSKLGDALKKKQFAIFV